MVLDYSQGGPKCVDEWDKSFDRGSEMLPLHSQFKPEEVTKSSLTWGPFWLLRLGHSFQLKSESTKALSEKLLLIPSKPNLSKPVSNSAKALSFSLGIRPCITYEGECVFHLSLCVYVCVYACVCVRVCVCVCVLTLHAAIKYWPLQFSKITSVEPQNVQHLMNIINYEIHIYINKLRKTYINKWNNHLWNNWRNWHNNN